MKAKRFFFLYQNTTELNLIKFILTLLPEKAIEKIVFCVETPRLNYKSLEDLDVKKIFVEDVKYSKYFIREFNNLEFLKRKLISLNINENDVFVTQPLYSLTNFIIYKFFKNKGSYLISYALNSITSKNNNFLFFNFLKSLKFSAYTFLYTRKLVFFYRLNKSVPHFILTKTYSDIHLDLGLSKKNELIISRHNLKFNKHHFIINQDKNSNKILLLIRSHSSLKIFGIDEDAYLLKIKRIIKNLESKSFTVFVKNHPTSELSTLDLSKKIEISIKNIIESKEDFEFFLTNRGKEFILFLTEDSNVALTLDFFNLNYFTINELILKGSSIYSKLYGLNAIHDLTKMKTLPKEKSNFNINKKLFKTLMKNV